MQSFLLLGLKNGRSARSTPTCTYFSAYLSGFTDRHIAGHWHFSTGQLDACSRQIEEPADFP
jgi:hypothetical protein